MRMLKLLLVVVLGCCAGCGTYFTHRFELAPVDEPYAGTKHDLEGLARLVACKEPSIVIMADDPSPRKTAIVEPLYRILCIGFGAIDTPLSFIADTVFLPFQAYWYLYPEVEQIKLKEESEKQRVPKLSD